jgi:hypothetical protein
MRSFCGPPKRCYAGHAKANKSLKDATKISLVPHGLCCLDRLLYNSRKDKLGRSS